MKNATRSPLPVTPHVSRLTFQAPPAFTLVEMLVVISILGVLAALIVPAFKSLGKSDATISATRQLLDDVGRARQLALNQRSTVYMVFVKTNFWEISPGNRNTVWFSGLSPAQQTAATNLCGKQLTGYTFVSLRTVGDQPGQGLPHYLASWQTLPDGTFIAQQKFLPPFLAQFFNVPAYDSNLKIYGFNTNAFPFPTAGSSPVLLPYIAFNYLGQLTVDGQTPAALDEYIPLARGSVAPAIDPTTRALQMTGSPSVLESPRGNSTNAYNLIHIDHLTGRARLEHQQVK